MITIIKSLYYKIKFMLNNDTKIKNNYKYNKKIDYKYNSYNNFRNFATPCNFYHQDWEL
jgi:hypothetical protein